MENFKHLLNDERVREEIERHKWIESEKAGYDVGFEAASESWLGLYGAEWARLNSQGQIAPAPLEHAGQPEQSKTARRKKSKSQPEEAA